MPTEKELTWSMVVESDEVYSAKTDKWYEVRRSANKPNGTTLISLKGLPAIVKKSDDPVMVRRGVTGVVVDMFVQVLSSG